MTLRRPEGQSVQEWLFTGWNARSILICVVMLVGAYYTQGTRVTVVEQQTGQTKKQFEDVYDRLNIQRDALQRLRDTKVDKDAYDGDQRRIADELQGIQLSVGRIEQILMESKR